MHDMFIKMMLLFGYESSEEGLCHGYAYMAGQAYFVKNGLNNFFFRTSFLAEIYKMILEDLKKENEDLIKNKGIDSYEYHISLTKALYELLQPPKKDEPFKKFSSWDDETKLKLKKLFLKKFESCLEKKETELFTEKTTKFSIANEQPKTINQGHIYYYYYDNKEIRVCWQESDHRIDLPCSKLESDYIISSLKNSMEQTDFFDEELFKLFKGNYKKQKIHDMNAFFDGIETYFSSSNYEHLLNRKERTSQANDFSPLLFPVSLTNEEDYPEKLMSCSGVYSLEELKQYFNLLAKSSSPPLLLILSASLHTVSLALHDDGWYVLDANRARKLNSVPFDEIAQHVIDKVFSEKSGHLILNTTVFSTKKNAKEFIFKHEENSIKENNQEIVIMDNSQLLSNKWNELLKVTQEKIEAVDSRGQTLLIRACILGNLSLVQEILMKMDLKKINHFDITGGTALFRAASNNHFDIVKLLLKCKEIDVNMIPQGKESILMSLARTKNLEMMTILLTHPDIDINKTLYKHSPFDIAIKNNFCEGAKLLLIRKINDYKHQRSLAGEYKQTFLGKGMGKSKTQKLDAISKLLSLFAHNEDPNELEKEFLSFKEKTENSTGKPVKLIDILNNGDTKEIIKDFNLYLELIKSMQQQQLTSLKLKN